MSISLEGSRPYRKMARTCQTRPIGEKKVIWYKIESKPFKDGRYQVKMLRRGRMESAAELWRMSYPELYGSPHEFLLDPEDYERLIALDERWDQDSLTKVYCMPVVEELETGKIIAATLLTKFERNLQLEFSFVATNPDYRMKDLTERLRLVTREIALKSGAEYFTTFCETWHDITQNWCMKGGWKIAGIFPGNFTRWNGDNREYRGCTVHFYKFVGDCEKYVTQPEEWFLNPQAREVWETLEKVN